MYLIFYRTCHLAIRRATHLEALVVPKFILPNFGNFLRRHQASRVKSKDLYLERYWVRLPPAGLG